MAAFSLYIFLLLIPLLLLRCTEQLQPTQYQTIARIKQQLNLPAEISNWSENPDLCNTDPTQILALACYEENLTQLHVSGANGFPHLLQGFSTVDLFTDLASLPSLKVLSLVSLGLRGALPAPVGNLSSLEILNISSNHFDGNIPGEISSLRNIQTLILDYNKFTGQFPMWLGSLPALSVLSMKNNSLSGFLPSSLSSMVTLRTLVISGNNLSGEVPGLHSLTNLQALDLEGNKFGPSFPVFPTKLTSLVLRRNKFHSAISDKLNSCYQLQRLDVSFNEFVGPFPLSLFSLPSLDYLDIGGNKFTGKLSNNMSCNAKLSFVNLSGNRFTGELPSCLLSKTGNQTVIYGGNCLSRGYKQQLPFSFCQSEALAVRIAPKRQEKRPYGKAVLASSMVGGIVGAMALVGLAFLVVKREYAKQHANKVPNTRLVVDKVSPAYTLKMLKDARYISETMKLGALGIPPYRTFVLDELKEATSNFNASNLIGEGSHGQVYKGSLTDGTLIAIRRLKMKKRYSIQTYTHQLELVSKLRQCYLVSAIGHCFECHQDDSSVSCIFLIFEFVPNGMLRSYVSGNQGQKLTWTQRLAAATGIAKGIQFLHTGIVPGVYNNHLKITDVLLDHNLHVKISKYNVPLLAEHRRMDNAALISRGSKQTFGSMLKTEEKNDVYDFGVILLEILVGRKIISKHDVDISKDILHVSLTADEMGRRSIVDPAVHKECSDSSLKTLLQLCVRCLSNESPERPSIEDVIWNLQFAAQEHGSWRQDSPVQPL